MKLRTFTAATMKEAMALVRAEMGEDAVIVYSHERRRGGGVEVRAAVEHMPVPRPAPAPAAKAAPPKARAAAPSPAKAAAPNAARNPAVQTPAASKPAAHKTTPKGLVALANAAKSGPDAPAHQAALDSVRRILAFHGVPERSAQGLMDTAHRLDLHDPVHLLGSALDTRFSFNPLPVKARRPLMLVGGPGAGKTVSAAKLAARALLAGHPVQVITTDTVRSGAIDQLETLLVRMGQPLITADTPEALAKVLFKRKRDSEDLVIIDTPGTNIFNASERADLAGFVDPTVLEPVLVQPAGLDANDAADIAMHFAELGCQRFLVTRLDAARRLGCLIAAAEAGALGIAQVSLSPYLSEPLSALSAGAVARILATQAGALAAPEAETADAPTRRAATPSTSTTPRQMKARAP